MNERPIRPFEWELWAKHLRPGVKILELGNKKNAVGVYKTWLQAQGYEHFSIDMNGQDGAMPFDLRVDLRPLLALLYDVPPQFDLVTNSGTIEHVIPKQDMAWQNVFHLTKVGGVQIHITPAADHWMEHGLYHPTVAFFVRLAQLNDMGIEHIDTHHWTRHKILTRVVLRKRSEREFVYPGDEFMCKTPDCQELEARIAAGTFVDPPTFKETSDGRLL